MTSRSPFGAGLGRSILRPTYIPAAIALAVILVSAFFADRQNQAVYLERARAEVLEKINLVRARLEGDISGNLQLARGLVAVVATEPDLGQERFAELGALLLDQESQIRNIAAAPDLVNTMVYPLEGNEQVIGLDYRLNAAQRDAAMRARSTGELVLAGPVNLVQGGQGIVGRFPVFLPGVDRADGFWGLISVVIDVDRLYRDSGLVAAAGVMDIAITGRDAMGGSGGLFFGERKVLDSEPVWVDVTLPSGSWRISASPKGGWIAANSVATSRLLMALGAVVILIPIFIAGRLIDERQNYIAALRSRELELERVSRRLGLALETSRVGVWENKFETGELYWDDRMNELYGYPADGGERDYSHWARRLHPEDRVRAEADFREAIEETGRYVSDYRVVFDNGEVRHIRAIGTVYREPGEPARIVGVNWDVSSDVALANNLRQANLLTEARNAELESAKLRIEFTALHDSLTGLPNRRFLDEVLTEHAERFLEGARATLLHIDLDRFKQINDTLGHAAGDAMLVHVAAILKDVVEPGDFVARVGGDEFVVFVRREFGSEEDRGRYLCQLADTIIDRMREPVVFEGHECRFGVSIGIASDTDSVADPKRLLVNADIALYRAKSRGRNRFQFFNDALQAEIVTTKRIADEILVALENGEFTAHYQPQFAAGTHELTGVEALARWNHPTRGVLAPAAFLKIAEELNVVAAIDRQILEQALRDRAAWTKAGIHVAKVSVNVSARRLYDDELIKSLVALDIEPGTVAFELVESIFMDEHDELLSWNVDRIKELGIEIEIDDFGTGYASIVSLLKIKPQRLKVDRQLIMPIVRSPAQRQLVGSIFEIGRSLGIEVIAEGVETMEHARILDQLGCDALQGYAFSRPMSAEDMLSFARACRWREAS